MNELDNCYRKGLLRKVEPSKTKSTQSIKEALKWLKETDINLESGAFDSAQLSVYLVFFHSARAVLFRDGIREKSHYCLGIYLDIAYHQKGLLEKKWILLFNRMRSTRHKHQYSFHAKPSEEELNENIKSARDFIDRISRLLEDI